MAVPVSLIGTFAVMLAFGFSLNLLTLLGLVLAIGIVVDDAIVVVEAVEHHMAEGLSRRDATIKAMSEVAGPIVAITAVLSCVFIPTAFIPGLDGIVLPAVRPDHRLLDDPFHGELAHVESGDVRAVPPASERPQGFLGRTIDRLLGWFFRFFNRTFERTRNIYLRVLEETDPVEFHRPGPLRGASGSHRLHVPESSHRLHPGDRSGSDLR